MLHESHRSTPFTPAPAAVLRRKCACGGGGSSECEQCRKKETLQRSSVDDAEISTIPSAVYETVRSPGRPLDPATRAFMDARFGHDFSRVRVHADPIASESAHQVHASAYSLGQHIVFGSGSPSIETAEGRRLLAHELAHTVQQQRAAWMVPASGRLAVGPEDDPCEREADSVASMVSRGESASRIGAASPPALQRYSHQDCKEDDLKQHVWPGDGLARQMTKKAIRVLSGPIPPAVTPLLSNHFKTPAPKPAALLKVYDKIDAEFRANDYQYECEESCSGTDQAYVYGLWSDIHLCMPVIRPWTPECIGRVIIHEFGHRYAGLSDPLYCNFGCGCSPCGPSLTAEKALDNCDSYACFALDLWPLAV